jgi:hypothetical protein
LSQNWAREHAGIFVLSGSIIDSNRHRSHFANEGIRRTFARHGLELVDARNLSAYPRAGLGATVAATMCRLLFGSALVDVLPDSYVYQRGYVASR